MYFRIDRHSVELVDPEHVTSFSVVCPPDLAEGELAESVRRADLGEVVPGGDHVMVAADAVRRMAAGRVGPTWSDDLEKMLGYAAKKGWTSDDGTRVRAHVERR